ncbi:mesothelin [Phyllostomus discolor]|uniref:Mesothelin n=1 Tax=Phyllostomus discolor TaxID=89673 RepID=A0A7E6DD75_9CHIR|nr:mesothelin isoform X2 [Phyllostomus discolor]XP_035877017.1 mesothelin isoform X3 [Phyllostomus discolor]KAF6125873.1 mesothelin [Phyllostomus discolor]
MALQSSGPTLGSFRTPTRGSLLLLLLSLRWALPSTAKTADTGQGVTTSWLQRTSWAQQPERAVVLPRALQGTEKKACPSGKEVHMVDEDLVFYEEWELEACVSGALLAEQMNLVNALPFTNEQLAILKHKLDQLYPQGYPESLIQNLSYFFLEVTPEDIHKWNVTSLETVKSLLKVSKGRKMDPQVAALIARYVMGGGQLDKVTLDMLASFHPTYLCSLSPEQLGLVQDDVLRGVRPQDLDACHPLQMDVLYHKAHIAFRNMSGSMYFARIKPFLGGASTEDLQALIPQNISMDMATFKRLRKEALLPLTIAEVQKLLGPNLEGLKAEEGNSPVRDWILRQQQNDLDSLGLGLHGGIPNGYMVLDLSFREALSGGSHLVGPGYAFIMIPALLLALNLN